MGWENWETDYTVNNKAAQWENDDSHFKNSGEMKQKRNIFFQIKRTSSLTVVSPHHKRKKIMNE